MTMRTKKRIGLLAGLAILIGGIALLMTWNMTTCDSPFCGRKFTLHGNTPPALLRALFHRRADSGREVNFVIGLKPRNEPELDALIARQADPNSPDFRKFITPDEFKARFAPEESTLMKVLRFLRLNKLLKFEVSPNGMLVHVKGTIKEVEEAFSVQMNEYELNASEHLSNDRDPSLPEELQDAVDSVIGLHNFGEYHPKHVKASKRAEGGPSGYGPKDIATAYNFPNPLNSVPGPYTGKGVTIAIATAYTYDTKDVERYWKQYGINRTGTVTNVYVNGTATKINGETTLDLQQAGAQAPGADIRMYIGHDASFATFALVFSQIVTENKCQVATVSWGLCEQSSGANEMKTEHRIFKQAAVQGIAFFAAAGDDGAYDCRRSSKTDFAVDYPSSDENITAVGGTALKLEADGKRKSESAWTGTGGGTSIKFERPFWQKGSGLPDGGKRHSSDVALVADPNTGYSTFFDGGWEKAGGTSFASPNWAGFWALAQEAYGSARLGPCNPAVYRLAGSKSYGTAFFDVVSGNNGDNRGPGFKCGPGWDHPTGWGCPNGAAFVEWMKNDKPAAPSSAPKSSGNLPPGAWTSGARLRPVPMLRSLP